MQMVFHASMDTLHKMLQFIRVEARAAGFDGPLEAQFEVALEEAIVNIIEHGYADEVGDIEIACTRIGALGLKVTLTDRGIPYNPLKKGGVADLDPLTPVEHRALGGYGVHLILSIMDQVAYERKGDFNVLTLIKYLK